MTRANTLILGRVPHVFLDSGLSLPLLRKLGDDVADLISSENLGTLIRKLKLALEHGSKLLDGLAFQDSVGRSPTNPIEQVILKTPDFAFLSGQRVVCVLRHIILSDEDANVNTKDPANGCDEMTGVLLDLMPDDVARSTLRSEHGGTKGCHLLLDAIEPRQLDRIPNNLP